MKSGVWLGLNSLSYSAPINRGHTCHRIDMQVNFKHGRTTHGRSRTRRVPPLIQKYRFFHKAALPQSICLSAPCLITPTYVTQTSVKSIATDLYPSAGPQPNAQPETYSTLNHSKRTGKCFIVNVLFNFPSIYFL